MTFQNSMLIELLNDDTFVAWVKGENNITNAEREKWNDWLEENPYHAILIEQVNRILEMPFNEVEIGCESSGELERLLRVIEEEDRINILPNMKRD
ncbi:hypothetical protein [Rhodohalobacter sp. 614A]|uniref:hypothetical protein n=1 Tax=Rhodohalobacter sp. 614A TaxID=2908649 RepID=UPI001F30E071|nr:hypothetical protein [Rhodohalobacter sp. 614A]